MDSHNSPVPFRKAPVLVGLMPGQDPVVLARAVELAKALHSEIVGAFVDPASYLIEWDPHGLVVPSSLNPPLNPEDETAGTAAELESLFNTAAAEHGVEAQFHVIAGDPALALGRFADELGAAVIVVGGRRRGFLAKAQEMVTGSMVHKLTESQGTPVLAVPHGPKSD